MVEDLSLRRIERRFWFCEHWRAIDKLLVRSIALNISQYNHYSLVISFSNYHHKYYFVNISSINAGREVIEDFSLPRIERRL